MRQANRLKGNLTPFEAFGKQQQAGFDYDAIIARASLMPLAKRYRFAVDGYERWLRDDKNFLARALNDTRYLSRIAREYVSLICPQNTRVIPGRMTAMLRAKFGLNDILGLNGEKNRNDHRHHAVDACVIGVTDQGLLQRFASANASSREKQLTRLVESMPLPWESYREHVARAVERIYVSHKLDHGFEGAMHLDTAYGLREAGRVVHHKMIGGQRTLVEKNLKVIEITSAKATDRHGLLENGEPKPYKGYDGNSNYCIEIYANEKGIWEGKVITTFEAYQFAREHGPAAILNRATGICGKPLLMRLIINDCLRLNIDGKRRVMRLVSVSKNGQIFLVDTNEANVDARNRNKDDAFAYISKTAGSLQKAQGVKVGITPVGEVVIYTASR